MLVYALIEDAVIAALRQASDSGALGYRFAEIGSYGGQFDDETFWTQFRRFPAAWVAIGGSRPRMLSPRVARISPVVAVMVGARTVRGERQTRHGTVGEPGTYQMLDDVRRLLCGSTLGLAIAPLAIGQDRTLYNTRLGNEGRSVLAAEFSTSFTYRYADPGADAPDLERIHADYVITPGDAAADAGDDVELRT